MSGAGSRVASAPPPPRAVAIDPNALLDAIESYTSKSSSPKQPPSTSTPDSNFDPIDFLNQHYTTESALLTDLPRLRKAASHRIATLNTSVSDAIQRQSERGTTSLDDVTRARTTISNLHTRIQVIQSKAEQSERTVRTITGDMKRLDRAKRHLQHTITTLKRLHMLASAVDQLEVCATLRPIPRFSEAAHLIDATMQLLGKFEEEGFSGISQIKDLKERVGGMRSGLYEFILQAFRVRSTGQDSATPTPAVTDAPSATTTPQLLSKESLSDGCQVVDALGLEFTHRLIDAFCTEQLSPYTKLFAPKKNVRQTTSAGTSKTSTSSDVMKFLKTPIGGSSNVSERPTTNTKSGKPNEDPACLDQIERRFAWFRRLLRSIDESFGNVFPHAWQVHYTLTTSFFEGTRAHTLALLHGSCKDRDAANATILLKALQKTMLFEREMTAWLQRECQTAFAGASPPDKGSENKSSAKKSSVAGGKESEQNLEFDEDGNAVKADSAQGIKIKYLRNSKKKDGDGGAKSKKNVGTTAAAAPSDSSSVMQVPPLLGMASSAFDNYMSPYISLERENMDEQISNASLDANVSQRGEFPVFTSSTTLFVYMKNSITRCTLLTRGKAFFLLHIAFRESLRKYATLLSKKFPSPISTAGSSIISSAVTQTTNAVVPSGGGNSGGAGGGGSGSNQSPAHSYRIPSGEEKTICHVIDTCEYCVDTVEALEELIREKMSSEYQSKVDMSGEQDAFQNVTAKGLKILVSGLLNRCDTALGKELASINWLTIDVVGEESGYVRSLHTVIQPFVASVRKLLPSVYFKSFCDKFARNFAALYQQSIVRQKRISEAGTQQLLLDVYNVKTLLLKLPITGNRSKKGDDDGDATTTAPAMYVRMVQKDFSRIEIMLKLVGTPQDMLMDVFKVNKASLGVSHTEDLQIVMTLKGMKRSDQQAMFDRLGLEAQALNSTNNPTAAISSTILMASQSTSDVAAKMNSDLSQMRQKMDQFRMTLSSKPSG
eukprot:CAMPEP_0194365750 /NCGR_PEP_ID=MMETSP0174-20130528/13777_1 /TAXON_ID=216777 /ORGANISM="Proboscia alata, Strain PI-D3" /LENGTH=1000 /DNA_ID=CAMNT_0039140585 /DNA_START=122 /DNA_END=3124 /DNA_ORIENTATION=-